MIDKTIYDKLNTTKNNENKYLVRVSSCSPNGPNVLYEHFHKSKKSNLEIKIILTTLLLESKIDSNFLIVEQDIQPGVSITMGYRCNHATNTIHDL